MLNDILRQLKTTRFRDLAGSHVTAVVPVSESLVNGLIATSLPANAPVRSVSIHPGAADGFSVRIVPKAALIPPVTLKLTIESQPQLPGSPVLTLRMVTFAGFFGLAGGVAAGLLPPGIRLEGERILVDLRALAAARGAGEVFDYLESLQVHTDEGRVVLHVDATVSAR